MAREQERVNESLALRSAYARLRHWTEELAAANAINNDELAQQASRFVAEYQDFIRELEQQSCAEAMMVATSSMPSAPAAASPLAPALRPEDAAFVAPHLQAPPTDPQA
jgi:hypothetical protein